MKYGGERYAPVGPLSYGRRNSRRNPPRKRRRGAGAAEFKWRHRPPPIDRGPRGRGPPRKIGPANLAGAHARFPAIFREEGAGGAIDRDRGEAELAPVEGEAARRVISDRLG